MATVRGTPEVDF